MKATVIGFGKLGKSLALKLEEKRKLYVIVSKHYKNLSENQKFPNKNIKVLETINELKELSDVVFITTTDNEIPLVSNEIARIFGNRTKGKAIIHCSGIYSDSILSELEEYGAITASAHPLQTFYEFSPNIFDEIFWIVQTKHFAKIQEIVESVGGTAIQVDFEDRTRSIYHASAVVASNFLNLLLLFAKKLISQTNLPPKILVPLVKQTIENNLKHFDDVDFTPLTGPIIRGDFQTIEKHLNALEQHKEMQEIYSLLFNALKGVTNVKANQKTN